MSTHKIAALSLLIVVVALTNSGSAQTLAHLWTFDDDGAVNTFASTFADSSGNDHTGTGAGDIVSGRFGNAVHLSDEATAGLGDGINWIGDSEDATLPIGAMDSWTISMWTNFDTGKSPENLEYIGGFGIDDEENNGNQKRARAVTAFPNYHF